MKIYIYVDDIRECTWANILKSNQYQVQICRDYHSTIDILNCCTKNNETFIDLDHDIGLDGSGYDICKYIVEHQIPLIGFHIHSMNPIGAQNMRQLLTHYGYKEY